MQHSPRNDMLPFTLFGCVGVALISHSRLHFKRGHESTHRKVHAGKSVSDLGGPDWLPLVLMMCFSLAVTSASWAVTWAATATHLKKMMKPWAQKSEKPLSSRSRTAHLTLMENTPFLSMPHSLMTLCSADRGWTESRFTNTATLFPTLAQATAHTSHTANPPRSPARLKAPGSTRAWTAAGIPTACHHIWVRKITPAVLETAAPPGTSSCPSPADTAPVCTPWSSPCLCAPTHHQLTLVTTLCLHTHARHQVLPAVLSALQRPSTGELRSTNSSGLSITQLTDHTVSAPRCLSTLTQLHSEQ